MNSLPKIVVSPTNSGPAVSPRPSDAVSQPLQADAVARAQQSTPIMRRIARTCLAACVGLPLVGALGACGQKGPLYLPAPTASPTSVPTNTPSGASTQPSGFAPQNR